MTYELWEKRKLYWLNVVKVIVRHVCRRQGFHLNLHAIFYTVIIAMTFILHLSNRHIASMCAHHCHDARTNPYYHR